MLRTSLVLWIAGCVAHGGSLTTAPLESKLQQLGVGFDGRVGICVQDSSGRACANPEHRFSLQSVVKLIVGIAVLDNVDRKGWKLDEPIRVRTEDLSVYVQPIAKLVTAAGYQTTVGDLVRRAIVDSDSAATDILFAKLGGPAEVQAMLVRKGIKGIRVDRNERDLQTEIKSLKWRPEFVNPAVLTRAIDAVPNSEKAEAYAKYQKDPRDTSTPAGMSSLLIALANGKLLSAESTKHVLAVMSQTVTFPDRLKAGTPAGWAIGHKTGTSGGWDGVVAATNDVGILTTPDGCRVAIAAFLGDSKESPEKLAAVMAKAAELTGIYYRGAGGCPGAK